MALVRSVHLTTRALTCSGILSSVASSFRLSKSACLPLLINRLGFATQPTLVIGAKASITKTFTPKDIQMFADVSEDKNAIHLDPEYAKTTQFGRPIVHGTLASALLASVAGTQLPGSGSILISFNMEFPSPLFVNEPVCAEVELLSLEGRRATMKLTCTALNSNKVVATGTCLVLVPKKSFQERSTQKTKP